MGPPAKRLRAQGLADPLDDDTPLKALNLNTNSVGKKIVSADSRKVDKENMRPKQTAEAVNHWHRKSTARPSMPGTQGYSRSSGGVARTSVVTRVASSTLWR